MKTAYLLGIGGAGMAGLAQFLRQKGVQVSGYDRAQTGTTKLLRQQGIFVHHTPNKDRLHKGDLCIYSAAFSEEHPLRRYAEEQLPTLSRGEMMGLIAREISRVVAVAGTHGKTTATGMLTHIVKRAGLDPSVLIGGHLPCIGGYGHFGASSLLICEACEYGGSFHHLKPTIGILLNVDRDHLEWYGSMDGLIQGFGKFTDGCDTCLVNSDDPRALKAVNHPVPVTFGLLGNPHLKAVNLSQNNGFFTFTLCRQGENLGTVTLKVPGKHQIYNALAAAGAGFILGIPFETIQKGLEDFGGVHRRFEILYEDQTLTVADDYAHHPTEIAAVLSTARTMGFSKITAIFQPFTYSRTALLQREFADALALAHRVILAPVMAGREPADPTVSSKTIAQYLPDAKVCESLSHCGAVALNDTQPGELIITLGCGNVNECAEEMADFLKNHK
ncbi:MAG: UDP-N-acetylmuramate--L-alanine ligase [Clostridia bacterium]|nr:UDP-N-acetylmuramate--L-alanine ligase [Clostridia bacterium]